MATNSQNTSVVAVKEEKQNVTLVNKKGKEIIIPREEYERLVSEKYPFNGVSVK